jgi:hypothetical protein
VGLCRHDQQAGQEGEEDGEMSFHIGTFAVRSIRRADPSWS